MKPRRLTAALGVVVAACSDAPPDGGLGAAGDPLVGAYCVSDVRASPGTVHFTGLHWLLNSAEAAGPIVLTVTIGTFVQPAMATTVTGVEPEDVSRAVGYSMSARRDLLAFSAQTLARGESSRLEAYTAFEESFWEVRDAQCAAVLGAGASFNPSGVFFQTVDAYHLGLPDTGLFSLVPGCESLTCATPAELGGGRDPGASDAGAPPRRTPGFIPADVNPLLSRNPARR
jgi:hypothetical protein